MFKKNRGFVLGILIFSFMFVGISSADSSVDVLFNINGCNFIFDGDPIGVSAGKCSSGESEGYFFCGTDISAFITTTDPKGCSFGADSYTLGDDFCCPAGYRCNETTLTCTPRYENCVDQENENDCENAGCVWLEFTEECSDNPRDQDCSYYETESACEEDRWDLGSDGVGSELCGRTIECAGTTYSVSKESCGCIWRDSAPEGEKCQLKMNATEMFYDPSSTPDKFECSNVFTLGNCTDGKQDVTWYSTNNILSGFPSGVPEECLDALNCNGGESTRFCGEPLIKLPGFSLFSLFASLLLIFGYYFFSEKFKYKRSFGFS